MQYVVFLLNVAFLLHIKVEARKIGYFWHLTDIHWDPNYNTKDHNCLRVGSSGPRGKYGEHSCDSPWSLVQSAAEAMANKQRDDIEFILWTGDSLTNSRNINKMAALTNLTHLLSQVFTSHFVFPVLGHDDPDVSLTQENPYQNLSELWKLWLPSEALVTFVKGGYYTIERRQRKLRLVALNTNLCTGSAPEEDPAGQWEWLETVLAKSKLQNETVYLAGHIAPGVDERVGGPPKPSMSSYHNTRYLSLIRKYADIITGQFFGHLHSDTFRVVYSELGFPISRLFLAPSVTPRRSSAGLNNPAFRLYKIEIDTGQVLDYSQFYLDLPVANAAPTATPTAAPDEEIQAPDVEWIVLYNLTEYYGFNHGSAEEFHQLAESFTVPEGLTLFMRYLQANSVYSSSPQTNVAGAHSHYCAVTRLDYVEYQNCLATAAAPLAATTAATPNNTAPIVHRHSSFMAGSVLLVLAIR